MTFHVTEELVQRQMENEEMIIDRGVGLYRVALMEAKQEGRMAGFCRTDNVTYCYKKKRPRISLAVL